MRNDNLALIIGGSSGMGLATAERLVKKGYNVLLVSHNEKKLGAAKEHLSKLSSKATIETRKIDIYNHSQVELFIKEIEENDRHIKYLVNAVGYFKPIPFLEHTQADYHRQLDVNKAFFFITQAVAKNMMKHGGGSIVNIGSMWAHQALKATPSSAYSMQKAGLHSLTQNLAIELAPHNIRVNAVAPAVVETPIYKAFIEPVKISQALNTFTLLHPRGRIGTANDIANTIWFLLSDKSDWTTGTIVNVDGGVRAGHNMASYVAEKQEEITQLVDEKLQPENPTKNL